MNTTGDTRFVDFNQEQTSIDRDQYEKDLQRRQREHLDSIQRMSNNNWQPCMHDNCSECHGTGVRAFGGPCIHMISCPCPKCTPQY